ncbi:hypothetical protein HK101_003045, partial [Irineochytrium annulatum]
MSGSEPPDPSSASTSVAASTALSARSYISLILFLATVVFCVRPCKVKLPLPWKRTIFLGLDIASAPVLAVSIQLASTVIKPETVATGFL